MPVDGGPARQLTYDPASDFHPSWSPDFKGKPRGNLGRMSLATDGKYVYFTWEEDFGDIWVMDVEWGSEKW
jgi:hypothetical protein